jgi:hypothetical protein
MFKLSDQAINHIQECHGDSNKYTPCKGKPDNTMYAWSLGPYVWQQFTSTIKESVWAHLTLVRVFHVIPLWAIHGWPVQYPSFHHCMYGRASSDLATINTTNFMGPHIFHMC